VTVIDPNFAVDTDGKSDIANEILYTGRRLDPETGLQINRWRIYASHLGRWLSRDPIGYEGSKWNLYEYLNGMPVVGLDPMGTDFFQKRCRAMCAKVFEDPAKFATCVLWCDAAGCGGCKGLANFCLTLKNRRLVETCLILHQRLCGGTF
jgi:RHS repeat-associated protein